MGNLKKKKMLLEDIRIEGKDEKFKISNDLHSSSWEHYYESYNYALEKIIEGEINAYYPYNKKARSLMFLFRHNIELCLKYNLHKNNKDIPISHNFPKIIEADIDGNIIPKGLKKIISDIRPYDHDDGSCHRYFYDKNNSKPYFSNDNDSIFNLGDVLNKYNEIKNSRTFEIKKIAKDCEYSNRVLNWNLTLYLGQCHGLGQLRTHYDFAIISLVNGIKFKKFDAGKLYLPLLFLIRHSFELALKFNIINVQSKSSLMKSKDYSNEHSLARLYNCYKGFLDTIDKQKLPPGIRKQFDKYKADYNNLNTKFHILDKNSRYFRYPVNREGESHDMPKEKIKLVEMLNSYYELDSFITFTNDILEHFEILK